MRKLTLIEIKSAKVSTCDFWCNANTTKEYHTLKNRSPRRKHWCYYEDGETGELQCQSCFWEFWIFGLLDLEQTKIEKVTKTLRFLLKENAVELLNISETQPTFEITILIVSSHRSYFLLPQGRSKTFSGAAQFVGGYRHNGCDALPFITLITRH